MIVRDPAATAATRHDVIVIGGGIYGACIAMEAARRGLRLLLVERDDFGGATSWNSLRIVHGGLRYLQSLDLPRFRESVQERRWFLRTFPDLVRPLPCLMPLYGRGLRRPTIFRAALQINDVLSRKRNNGVRRDRCLGAGRMLSPVGARLAFPLVKRKGLCGAGLWHDAAMVCPQRIVIEILKWACSKGATALNYTEVTGLLTHRGVVEGVCAIDRTTHETMEFRAPIVINAAGPWCRALASALTGEECDTSIFRPSLAYNLLINRPPLSECAVAISSGRPGSRVYFMHNVSGGVLAGTEHAPVLDWNGGSPPHPTPEQIDHTLGELNAAIPGWNVKRGDVLRVHCGLLPARRGGTETLAVRETICNHGRTGGPRGLLTVSGVKFTTARLVAEKAISRVMKDAASARNSSGVNDSFRCESSSTLDLIGPDDVLKSDADRTRAALNRLIEEEAVVTLDDLLLRRTGWLDDPRREPAVHQRVAELMSELSPAARDVAPRDQLMSEDRRAKRPMQKVGIPPSGNILEKASSSTRASA